MTEPIYNSWGSKVPSQFGLDEKKPIKALIGWQGLALFDPEINLLEVLQQYLQSVQQESCGRCVPCRLGSKIMLEIVNKIILGQRDPGDLDNLTRLAALARDGSLCEIGRSFPIAVVDVVQNLSDNLDRFHGDDSGKHEYYHFVSSPCVNSCPAHLDIPEYVQKIDEEVFEDGLQSIRSKTIFAGTLGRVCGRFCESNCRRNTLDQPVNIRGLKRFLADYEQNVRKIPQAPKTQTLSQKVAIVGGGPAGLSAAYQLARAGFRVSVFEAREKAGGLLTSAYPSFKLPQTVVQREIDLLCDLGVEFRFNIRVGRDVSLSEVRKEGFEAILLTTGLKRRSRLSGGMIDGLEFLESFARDPRVAVGKRVVVIGSGHLAVDCARAAVRCGAEDVGVLTDLSREDYLIRRIATGEAAEEGVQFFYDITKTSAAWSETAVSIDYDQGELVADTVILAGRAEVDKDFLASVDIDVQRLASCERAALWPNEAIFAAGELVSGELNLAEVVAQGNRAAQSIIQYLESGQIQTTTEESFRELMQALPLGEFPQEPDILSGLTRIDNTSLSSPERKEGDEVVREMPACDATEEASRCARCYRLLMVMV